MNIGWWKNQYSQLLFTSEYRLCTNVHVQDQLTNLTSQCQYLTCDITGQLWWRHNALLEMTILGDNGEMSDTCLFFGGFVCSRHIQLSNVWLTFNNDFGHYEVIRQWISLVAASLEKHMGKSPHSWPKIIIQGKPYTFVYVFMKRGQIKIGTCGFLNVTCRHSRRLNEGRLWRTELFNDGYSHWQICIWSYDVRNRYLDWVNSILTKGAKHRSACVSCVTFDQLRDMRGGLIGV